MNTIVSGSKLNLLGLSKKELEEFFISIDEKPFRATQIIKWVHQRGVAEFSLMTDLSKDLRSKLESICYVKAPEVVHEQLSTDGTRKWVVNVGNNDLIEMVLIPDGDRATLCVSSQVGCAVDCSFCATGKEGFSRNLTLDEIIGQVWVAANSFGTPRHGSDRNVTNVVMMGMGEPLHNFEPVVKAMDLNNNSLSLIKLKECFIIDEYQNNVEEKLFYSLNENYKKMMGNQKIDGVSTLEKTNLTNRLKKNGFKNIDNYIDSKTVKTYRLENLLKKNPIHEKIFFEVDFLQIDAEGYDDEIIYNSGIQKLKFKYINYEFKNMPDFKLNKLHNFLKENNYKVLRWNKSDEIAYRI